MAYRLFIIILAVSSIWDLTSCCQAPPVSYDTSPYVISQAAKLQQDFLQLLPSVQASQPAAVEEAHWLAHTAYLQAAKIARSNNAMFFGWINNIMVNADLLDRGLCYHYQQDMFRELRRRHLNYFHLGLTVRDKGTGSSHSCVYVNAKGKGLKDALVLDAWKHCGHLVVIPPKDRRSNWQEDVAWQNMMERAFPEAHTYPFHSYLKESINTGNPDDD